MVRETAYLMDIMESSLNTHVRWNLFLEMLAQLRTKEAGPTYFRSEEDVETTYLMCWLGGIVPNH